MPLFPVPGPSRQQLHLPCPWRSNCLFGKGPMEKIQLAMCLLKQTASLVDH